MILSNYRSNSIDFVLSLYTNPTDRDKIEGSIELPNDPSALVQSSNNRDMIKFDRIEGSIFDQS